MAYAYGHKRLDKNEFFYIGIGNDNNYTRANKKIQRTKHWHNIVNKTDYEVIIIEDNLSWEEACEREKYWIKFYGRKDLQEGNLVNLTDGGEGAVGVIRSEETKEKLRKIHTGRKHSKESLKKMSDAQKERFKTSPSPRKGVTLTDETKEKIREKRKLQITTEETKKKMSQAMMGRVMSEEWKQKISKSNTGKKVSEETKKKIGLNNWMKGKSGNLPEEYIQKLRDAQLKRWAKIKSGTDELLNMNELIRRKKISEVNIGRIQSEETKKKISIAKKGLCSGDKNPMFGRKMSNETKQKISIALLGKKHKNPVSEETKKKISIAKTGKKHKKLVISDNLSILDI
jgi:hypothetical protein